MDGCHTAKLLPAPTLLQRVLQKDVEQSLPSNQDTNPLPVDADANLVNSTGKD
jgi:hypothetical protein